MGGPLVEVSTLLQAGSCHIQVMDRVAANDKNFFNISNHDNLFLAESHRRGFENYLK